MEMAMPMMILITLHVLPGVFWVGSTFVLARTRGEGAERLTWLQLGAAGIVVASGMVLWSRTHAGVFGPAEQVLATGALSALAAAGIQAVLVLPSLRRLASPSGDLVQGVRTRIAIAESVAAGLLAITVVCMVIVRYV